MVKIRRGGSISEDALVELIKRAQHYSDPNAIDDLYLLFSDRLFRYLLTRLQDAKVAEQITVQRFVRLGEEINQYQITPTDNIAGFLVWLYQMVHQPLVEALQARKHPQWGRLEEAAPGSAMPVSAAPISAVEEQLARTQILEQLQDWNDLQRDVIVLRFIEKLSLDETAQIIQKSEDGVISLQQQALESLHRSLRHVPKTRSETRSETRSKTMRPL